MNWTRPGVVPPLSHMRRAPPRLQRLHGPRKPRAPDRSRTDAPSAIAPAALAACALLAAGGLQAQTSAEAGPTIEVIGTAPMPGLGVPRDRLPYGAASVRRSELEQRQAETLGDHLTRQLPGVQSNDIQGSPYQADLTLRGFRASALLGAAQGVAVYLDGVRINEPFGDVVLWDLVPEFVLDSVTVVPGANPAFGLNALGGSIALAIQDGRSAGGVRALASGGSFGRGRVEMSLGQRHGEGWHSLVAASHFNEDGWRDFSPGRNSQLLAKVGHDAGRWSIGATFLGGRSTLVGNGLVPAFEIEGGVLEQNLYREQRRAVVYTHPDRSRHQLGHGAVHGELDLGSGLRAQGLVYARHTRRDTINGDAADELDPAAPEINASLNTTRTRQRALGLAASIGGKGGPGGAQQRHQWQVGLNLDRASVAFEQQEQEASFDATRGARAGGEDPETSVRVAGRTTQFGVYATDTWSLAPSTHLTGTLRANQAHVANTLETADAVTGELVARPRESFTYRSLNPALGVVQELGAGLAAFGNVARNARVPTVIELGCADPAEPCRLPAGLQSDPYLRQVRSTSVELGLRWSPSATQRFEALAFRTDNRDDIVFGSVSTTGSLGYFRNFPRTRHQGLELQWSGRGGRVTGLEWSLSAARLDATYQATDTLRQGERNVEVTPGTPIAGLPRKQGKVALDWRFAPSWSVGLDVQGVGSRRVQGNEDRRLEDGGPADTTLRVAGYGLVNLRAAWRAPGGIEIFAAVRNAFDRRHENYAALAETVFDEDGVYTGVEEDALFVAPGAPRSVQVGVRLRW